MDEQTTSTATQNLILPATNTFLIRALATHTARIEKQEFNNMGLS